MPTKAGRLLYSIRAAVKFLTISILAQNVMKQDRKLTSESRSLYTLACRSYGSIMYKGLTGF